jgi:hypothetical protein
MRRKLLLLPLLLVGLLTACAGLSDRQILAGTEVAAERAYDQIAFMKEAGELDEADIEAMRPYEEKLHFTLAVARRQVHAGQPAGDTLADVNKALQELILERERRKGARP